MWGRIVRDLDTREDVPGQPLKLTIDGALHRIFRAPKARPWGRRLLIYGGVLVFGPLLIGGSRDFIPASAPGSRRKDNTDWIEGSQKLGYDFVSTATELNAAKGSTTSVGDAAGGDEGIGRHPPDFDLRIRRQHVHQGLAHAGGIVDHQNTNLGHEVRSSGRWCWRR